MTPRTIRILLIVSLTLNVFIFGAVAGGAFMWTRADDPPALAQRQSGGGLRQAGGLLPDEQRRAFRQALRGVRQQSAALIEQGREGRQEAARLLSEPTVDQAAVNAALSRARAADIALRARLEDRIVTFAATLPAEQRRTFVDALQRRGQPQRPRRD